MEWATIEKLVENAAIDTLAVASKLQEWMSPSGQIEFKEIPNLMRYLGEATDNLELAYAEHWASNIDEKKEEL